MKKSLLVVIIISVFINFLNAQNSNETAQIKPAKNSYISFKSVVYDFGTIKYDEEAIGIFEFKNISNETIQLTNVKASCGCTGTEWPRDEIKKKKKEVIKVSYDTKRVGKFHKMVYVYVDKSDNPIQLEIKGTVLPSENEKNNTKVGTHINGNNIELQKSIKVIPNTKSEIPGATKSKTIGTPPTTEEQKTETQEEPRIEQDTKTTERKGPQEKETNKEKSKTNIN